MVLLLTLKTSLRVVVISNNVQTVKVQGLYIPVVAAKRLFYLSCSSKHILILLFLWYRATHFRGIEGDCRLAAPLILVSLNGALTQTKTRH